MTAPCSKSIKAQVFAAGEDRPRGPAAACGPGASLVNDRALHTGSVGPRLRHALDHEPEDSRLATPDAHSLCLDLTIKSQSRPGQPWCEVQGSVDTKPFLHYDTDSNEVKPLGLLGKEVTATKAWTELSQTLAEVGQELRKMLPVLKPHKNKTRGPPTLQAELCCRREAERCTGASWQFSIDGHTALLLDAMNMKWTVISPGDTGIEEWENDQGLAEYFRKTSVGDCNHWFQEFLEHWEERLEPEPTAPTLLSSDNEQSTDLQLMAWVIPSIFVSLVLIGITIRNYRRSRTTQGQSEGCVYPELFLPLPPLPVSPLLSGSSAP
ncbi:Retinoic acid early transcript 1E, partial [Camelus dromedarius]